MKWMGEAYYNWRKGNEKDLQTELETQNHIVINDQIQARPLAVQHLMARR